MRVIIGCGKAKHATPRPAADLYTSGYFRTAVRWARSIVADDAIWILSAKYGLVPASQTIAPYHAVFEPPTGFAVTSEPLEPPIAITELAEQAAAWRDPVILLAGQSYYRRLAVAAPHLHPFNPILYGLPDRRQGYQMQAMNRNMGRIPERPSGIH